jgi:hypothetical protein
MPGTIMKVSNAAQVGWAAVTDSAARARTIERFVGMAADFSGW